MKKILIIQSAFIGDVVLATGIAETLHRQYPDAQIDFLLRKGNEGLLKNHPFLQNVWVWNKKKNKQLNLLRLVATVRRQRYDAVINAHRFASSGLITFFSGAAFKAGFDKNPFSFCYQNKVPHIISAPYDEAPLHETDRNHALIAPLTSKNKCLPRLYPSQDDQAQVALYQSQPYVCMAPSSVWWTKQFPAEKWASLINDIPAAYTVYLLGAPGDDVLASRIIQMVQHPRVVSLCGKLSFLASAALMKGAAMNYANDSAPLHFATAVQAPMTAVFCSTVPAFGFTPLSQPSQVVEVAERLYCRPCGLHGRKACPEGHFKCAQEITNKQLLWWISK